MTFLSEPIGRPVDDVTGWRVGPVADLVVTGCEDTYGPERVAFQVKHRFGLKPISPAAASILTAVLVHVGRRFESIGSFRRTGACLHLAADVLDKRVIDLKQVR